MYFGLAFAFTVIGLTAGYLVAASETPVVSAALPILAGLATAAIAVVTGRVDLERIGSYVKDLAKEAKQRDPAAEVATLTRLGRLAEDHTRSTVRALGLLTTLFALGFAGGLGTGTWVRVGGHVNAWAHPVAGPWSDEKGTERRTIAMVDSFEGALYWLGLEQQLRRSGVPKGTIAQLYEQYVKEFDEVVVPPSPDPDPEPAPGGAALRMSPRTAAHRAVAGGTFASVAAIAPGRAQIPTPVPAVFMEILEALRDDVLDELAVIQAAPGLDAGPALFRVLEELAALRRDGASWSENTLELADVVAGIRREFDDLPRTQDFEAQFGAFMSRIDAPRCWTPLPLEQFDRQGGLGIDPGSVRALPFGVVRDVAPAVPGLEVIVPPLVDGIPWSGGPVPTLDGRLLVGSWGPCTP
jgi:hypothetical protein